ncbi:MAG: proton-conducting transporter membrane subunit [bacterium]
MSLDLIIISILLAAVSGLPGLCLPRSSVWNQRVATGIMVGGALVGWVGAWSGLCVTPSYAVSRFPWPAAGNSVVGIDALSSFFLVPIFLMGGLGSIYGLGYWPQSRHPGNGRRLRLFWGLLVAGMALLVIGRHAMAFLLGWEVMALSAFFLVSAEDHREECRRAGWIYLIATHIATLTLFALFILWHWATGSYTFQPVAHDTLSLGAMHGLFFLGLLGFGIKAGMMPLHFWLPVAHANAPSHVSAMLSGVVIKMGIYGLVRWLSLFPDPPAAWGGLILALGAISGLLGVVFAIGQHDLKRLLAYHSVENIGIILMGLGLAMLGRSTGRPEWIVLGLAGCLLHVWNHSLFKTLLFLCAGSVVHSTHTRQIDRLGGLAKTMPWTASLFLIGAVAICGLPPLNGFVSELFIYLGLLRTVTTTGTSGSAAVIGVPVLAMIGALAVACFVKVYGIVFLGNPRTHASARAHESPVTMRGPMVVLAAGCALIGMAPLLVSPILDKVIAGWSPGSVSPSMSLNLVAPVGAVGAMSVALMACIVALTIALAHRSRVPHRVGTWDCGYARPTSRMQYTASSFAQMIVAMFGLVLHPRVHRPHLAGLFPERTEMHSHVDDAVLDRLLVPTGHGVERWFGWFHRFQQGLTQHYMLYILITVLLMLSTLMPIKEIIARLFAR